MDKLIIALFIFIFLCFVIFYFVMRFGLGQPETKEERTSWTVLKKLTWGANRYTKGRRALHNRRITLT